MPSLLLVVVVLLLLFNSFPTSSPASSSKYTYTLHNLLSDDLRPWPADRYAALAERDRRSRRLAEGDALAFAGGSETLLISTFAFLHYVEVEVGTPRATFLVALDTGSDLFWLPCDCQSCAPTPTPTPTPSQGYGLSSNFGIYNSSSSLTSRNIFCNSTLCEVQSMCSEGSDFCPYKVEYISPETTSSGVLLEDVLHLTTEDSRQEAVKARIIFGCGQAQTGLFLRSAAPNGLLGLGMSKISVPSILASSGLVSDSYSMCFEHDGSGKITLGDQGSSDQEETPFNINHSHPAYVVIVTGITVGNSSYIEDFSALVDSGSSFTTLSDPAYTHITESFDSQVLDRRHNSDHSQSHIPFEYCYISSSDQSYIPAVSFTMEGGSKFPVSPIAPISPKEEGIYCLAVVKGSNGNIIGQNFLTGLKIVFDRERLILGWKKSNCRESENFPSLPPGKHRNSSIESPRNIIYDPDTAKHSGRIKQISYLDLPLLLLSLMSIF